MVKVLFFLFFSDRPNCSRPNSNIKKSIFRFFFYFAVPPTPQIRPEDGMSTKKSIVPRLIDFTVAIITCTPVFPLKFYFFEFNNLPLLWMCVMFNDWTKVRLYIRNISSAIFSLFFWDAVLLFSL